MADYEPRWLDELGVIARTWHNQRDNADADVQNIRESELDAAHRLLQAEMEAHRQRRMTIVLHVGEQALEAISFRKVAYGFLEANSAELEPRSTLPLVRTMTAQSITDRSPQPYYGNYTFVNFAAIAQTLTQDGRLESVDGDEHSATAA